jgi:hypothetical protein
MLNDINYFAPGAVYPPASEKARIQTYTDNNKLFLSKHTEVWGSAFSRLSDNLVKRNVKVDTVLNYQKLMSIKTADFICGEPPAISCGERSDELNALLSKNEFDTKLYEAVIDISRLGNGVLKIVGKKISIVDARYWFPVAAPENLKEVTAHIIAYPIKPGKDGNFTELYCEIHQAGKITVRYLKYDGGTVGALINETETQTGLDFFAVIPLTNTTFSGGYYGIDDYGVVNSIIKKIMWRLACADKILDKHTEPSVSGPESALEYDEKTGMYFVPLGGNYFRRDKDDAELKYITWDGNLESNFKEIDLLFEQLYILSEMGTAFLEGGSGGAESSGRALKLRMTSPRIKAQRIIGLNAERIKNLIFLLAKVNKIDIKREAISLEWKDGLPVDPAEKVDILTRACGNKPVISQYTAVQKYGELSEGETDAELERIQKESAIETPEIFTGELIEDE